MKAAGEGPLYLPLILLSGGPKVATPYYFIMFNRPI
ncbi:hypothetical protein BGS_0468 [Beggiatoa sp. SS]|nr:hypothetical protein BGS_0468 [Beggiatoa sp. SS]